MKFYRFQNDSERKILHQAAGLEGKVNFTWPYFIIHDGVGDYSQHNGLGAATMLTTVNEALAALKPFKAHCVVKSRKSQKALLSAVKNSARKIDTAALNCYNYFVSDDDANLGAGFCQAPIGRRISIAAMIKWLEETPPPINTCPVYAVVQEKNLELLVNQVNRKLIAGWMPQGGVSQVTKWDETFYMQAMVLP